MKKITLFYVVLSLLFAISCTQKKEPAVTAGEETMYACPMKCEGETVYPVAGKCPVCGMDLQPVKDVEESPVYEMRIATVPEAPEAGKTTRLIFTPKLKSDENAQVPLDEVHEKKLHVIIVSNDLAWYDHVHPEFQADGTYTLDEVFPTGGEFIVFADYQPTGAGNQVERHTIAVTGVVRNNEPFTKESLKTQTNGYTVTLKPSEGKLVTNNLIHLGVEVMEGKDLVTDFENIMGTKGHLVIISGDGQKYLHVHPEEVDGKIDLHTQFDSPGIYRAYFQFQTAGKVHTSYFTLDVKEGKPGELGGSEDRPKHGEPGHDHEHDHEH